MEKLRYTQDDEVAVRLFERLDDDKSASISIEEIRPDRQTNFHLPAFMEAVLKPVITHYCYSGDLVLASSMGTSREERSRGLLSILSSNTYTTSRQNKQLFPAGEDHEMIDD